MKSLSKVLAPALLVLALAGIARADHEVYLRTLPATVMVVRQAENGAITGSGVLVDLERRLVVTNYHVVGDSSEVLVVFPSYDRDGKLIAERSAYGDRVKQLVEGGRIVSGRVVNREAQRDLALIELAGVPKDAKALRLAVESPKPGERVHSIGSPGASEALWLYTHGTVRQVYQRTFTVDGNLQVSARVVETQSPTNSGDSGGPVVNDRGELVAVVESSYSATNGKEVRLMSTFIDVSEVKALLHRYAEEKGQTNPSSGR